jgi:hypothetical protein
MADVDAASLAAAAGELADGGRPVVPVVCDVASAEDVEALRTATSAAGAPGAQPPAPGPAARASVHRRGLISKDRGPPSSATSTKSARPEPGSR